MNIKHLTSAYDYFIFDFDGVVVQSNEVKKEGFRELYKYCSKPIQDETI